MGWIAFDPPLPTVHSHLLQRLLPGAIIRVHTVYPEPFWRAQRLSGQILAPQSPVSITIDQTPWSGQPGVLSSYAFVPAAMQVSRLGPKERRELWLGALAERFGPQDPPTGYLSMTMVMSRRLARQRC